MGGLIGEAQTLAVYHYGYLTLKNRTVQDHERPFPPPDVAAVFDWGQDTHFTFQDKPPLAIAMIALTLLCGIRLKPNASSMRHTGFVRFCLNSLGRPQKAGKSTERECKWPRQGGSQSKTPFETECWDSQIHRPECLRHVPLGWMMSSREQIVSPSSCVDTPLVL